jgi:hypothetical protein
MALEHVIKRIVSDEQFAERFRADARAALAEEKFELEEEELGLLLKALERYHGGQVLQASGRINWLVSQFRTSTT